MPVICTGIQQGFTKKYPAKIAFTHYLPGIKCFIAIYFLGGRMRTITTPSMAESISLTPAGTVPSMSMML